MKVLIIFSLVIFGTLVAAQDSCYSDIESTCKSPPSKTIIDDNCHAQYGVFEQTVGVNNQKVSSTILSDLQNYMNNQLATSYDYLKAATFFNSYSRDRPGFVKLFRSLSDKAFEDSIKLIKHITQRGGKADFDFHKESGLDASTYENGEVNALGKALDKEKALAKDAIKIHENVSKPHSNKNYDPEISQFLEEEFLVKQSKVIRKLSGYSNDLWKLVKTDKSLPALSIYLFDQYLEKQ